MKLKQPICKKELKQFMSAQSNPDSRTVTTRPYEKNRKAAAAALHNVASGYERISLKDVYRKCYFDKSLNAWRLIGKAHDYTY